MCPTALENKCTSCFEEALRILEAAAPSQADRVSQQHELEAYVDEIKEKLLHKNSASLVAQLETIIHEESRDMWDCIGQLQGIDQDDKRKQVVKRMHDRIEDELPSSNSILHGAMEEKPTALQEQLQCLVFQAEVRTFFVKASCDVISKHFFFKEVLLQTVATQGIDAELARKVCRIFACNPKAS